MMCSRRKLRVIADLSPPDLVLSIRHKSPSLRRLSPASLPGRHFLERFAVVLENHGGYSSTGATRD